MAQARGSAGHVTPPRYGEAMVPMPTAGRGLAVALALSACAVLALAACGLAAVGMVSWRRTAPLRRALAHPARNPTHRDRPVEGRGPVPPGPGRHGTSPSTFLAAAAGGAIGLGGLVLALSERGPPRLGLAIAALGAGVVGGGLTARVTALEVGRTALVVRYALRRPFVLSWVSCTAVRPPRWPLGGWRLLGPAGSRTLMPSDLLGLEGVLTTLVERTDLAAVAAVVTSAVATAPPLAMAPPPPANAAARCPAGGPGARPGPGRGASRPPPPRPARRPAGGRRRST